MKRLLIVLLCLTLFSGLAPHGWSKTPKDTLVVAMRSAPPTLDPHIQDTIPTWSQLATVYERLVTFDEKGKMQNELMTDWELIDPLTWKISLRKGVKFHNGEPFTSNAVKVSIEKYVDPTLKTP
jgi:peptide/nickel transport system substrate-binding protein